MMVAMDAGKRAKGGTIHMEDAAIRWQPEPPDPTVEARAERLNLGGRMVDFGPAVTNGAFRLQTNRAAWQLIPLPGSPAFEVKLRLDQLNAAGRKVGAITVVDADGNVVGSPVRFRQDGQAVDFETVGKAFGYRISVAN
jgi:hypothetical protein